MIKADGVRLFAAKATGIRDSVAALVLLSAAGHVGAVLWAISDASRHEVAADAGSAVVMEVTLIAGPARANPGASMPPAQRRNRLPTEDRFVSAEAVDPADPSNSADRATSADRRILPDTTESSSRPVDQPATVAPPPIPPPRPATPDPARDLASLPLDRTASPDRPTIDGDVASESAAGEPASDAIGAAPRADNPAPAYPASARLRGQEGRVLLRVEVLASGDVESVALDKSSGVESLDKAALDTVRRWRFRPARKNGHPITVTVQVPIRFALK